MNFINIKNLRIVKKDKPTLLMKVKWCTRSQKTNEKNVQRSQYQNVQTKSKGKRTPPPAKKNPV